MENKEEDEIRKRWEQEARDKALQEQQEALDRPRKRPREIEYARGVTESSQARTIDCGLVTPDSEIANEPGNARLAPEPKAKTKAKGRKAAIRAATRGLRAKGRITEITEDDEEYIELD